MMKASNFKELIKESVREVIKEEIADILYEGIKSMQSKANVAREPLFNSLQRKEQFISTAPVRESHSPMADFKPTKIKESRVFATTPKNPISSIFQETANTMSEEDYEDMAAPIMARAPVSRTFETPHIDDVDSDSAFSNMDSSVLSERFSNIMMNRR